MLSSSFPVFALSNHTTFSLSQTGATVPLSVFHEKAERDFVFLETVPSYSLTAKMYSVTGRFRQYTAYSENKQNNAF
jgi:hypothetical protein